MPFVTSYERYGMLKAIAAALQAKFGDEGAALAPAIRELNDAEKFLALSRVIATATSFDEVRRAYAKAVAPRSRRKRKRSANGRSGQS